MIPLPILVSGATSAAQLLGGFGKLARRRPEYEIPESARRALGMASARATDPRMPGYGQAQENINLAAANAMSALQQSGNTAIGLQGVVGQAQAANRDLSAQNEMSQQRDLMSYESALGTMGEYEDLQFQMNEFAPYSDRQQEGRDMIGGGLENLMLTASGAELLGLRGGVYMEELDENKDDISEGVGNVAEGVSSLARGVDLSSILTSNVLRRLKNRGY
jgi:hypothetical protein